MKKVFVIIALVLLLVGCGGKKPVVDPIKEPKFVKKLDDSKPYIYTEPFDDYDLTDLLKKIDTIYSSDFYSGNFVKESFPNNRISINIDSDDARRVEQELLKKNISAKEDRTKNAGIFNDYIENSKNRDINSLRANWSSLYLHQEFENDSIVSLITIDVKMIFGSESFLFLDAYVFSKEDGHLLTQDEVLKVANTTLDDLGTDLFSEEHDDMIYTTISEGDLVEIEVPSTESYTYCARLAKDNSLGFLKNGNLFVVLDYGYFMDEHKCDFNEFAGSQTYVEKKLK